MMSGEIWKDTHGYENLYQVSSFGRIKKVSKIGGYFGHINRGYKHHSGYRYVNLTRDTKRKHFSIGRLVLTAFDRPPKDSEECNHKDGNKDNNHIENLEWCTAKENSQHRDNVLGRGNKGKFIGENSTRTELTDIEAREIKGLLKQGKLTQKQIAERFNIKVHTVGNIKLGRAWKHI